MAMNSVWMHHKKINWKLDVDKIWQSGWWLKRLADVVVGGSPEMQMIWREKKKSLSRSVQRGRCCFVDGCRENLGQEVTRGTGSGDYLQLRTADVEVDWTDHGGNGQHKRQWSILAGR